MKINWLILTLTAVFFDAILDYFWGFKILTIALAGYMSAKLDR